MDKKETVMSQSDSLVCSGVRRLNVCTELVLQLLQASDIHLFRMLYLTTMETLFSYHCVGQKVCRSKPVTFQEMKKPCC